MKKLLIIVSLILGCSKEPQECPQCPDCPQIDNSGYLQIIEAKDKQILDDNEKITELKSDVEFWQKTSDSWRDSLMEMTCPQGNSYEP